MNIITILSAEGGEDTVLAEIRLPDDGFPCAEDLPAEWSPENACVDIPASANGVATHYRIYGNEGYIQGTIGGGGGMTMDNTSITTGQIIRPPYKIDKE